MASTILFPSPIFGPVHSRRLGTSLGINLLPAEGKICSFDCIYCECGFNSDGRTKDAMPTREEVAQKLRAQLDKMVRENLPLDVITFAGNGEPTLHPEFLGVMEDTIRLRDEFFPEAKVSVLTNGAQLTSEKVFRALQMCDNNIVKLDTVDMDYIRLLDRPVGTRYDVRQAVEKMREFNGHCIVQTMFLQGSYEGRDVSNVSDKYIKPWIETLLYIQPEEVMIYTIERNTPSPHLEKATPEQLDSIAEQVRALGLKCQVSY